MSPKYLLDHVYKRAILTGKGGFVPLFRASLWGNYKLRFRFFAVLMHNRIFVYGYSFIFLAGQIF